MHITDSWFETGPFPHVTHKATKHLLASALNLVTICEQWIMSFFPTVLPLFLQYFLVLSYHLMGDTLPFAFLIIYCKMVKNVHCF